MKALLLTAALLSSSCALAEEQYLDEYDEYSYPLAFPLICTSTEEFLKNRGDDYFPVLEFLPPEEVQSEFSTPSYLFMNSDGEFFITMPADVPEDTCFAQRGVVNRVNREKLLNFLGFTTL